MAKRTRKKKTQPVPETPTCNCVLLCDDVLMSARNKHTLVGVIGIIAVRELPATIGGYVIYVRIQNVYGSRQVQIALENADSAERAFQFDVQLPAESGPLGLHTVVAQVPPFQVERAGKYWFLAASDGEVLAQSPIEIVVAKAPDSEPGEA